MSESRIVEVTDEEAEKFMESDKKDAEKPNNKENGTAEKGLNEQNETEKEEEDPEDKGKLKPNSGNGCDLPHGRYVSRIIIGCMIKQIILNLTRTIIRFIAYASNFRYNWTQTLEEIDLRVPLPMALKGKDLIVEIKRKHLKVAIKGKPESIIDGELLHEVKAEECLWNIEDKRYSVAYFQTLYVL